MDAAAATAARPSPAPRGLEALARRLGLDRFGLAVLGLLAASSLALLVPLLTRGRPLSGSDGFFPADQLQYFAWIREAAHHGLIGNVFDLAPQHRVFFHPGYFLSGMLAAATGISYPLAYLLWKPVAVVVMFWGALLYVRRLLPPGAQRRVALVIVLFAVMPACAIVAWTHWGGRPRQYTFDFISGEMWSGQYLWGYLFTAIAVFLVPLVLLRAESWRERRAPARALVLAALGAVAIMWLQPWQGATLALIVIAVEAYRRLRLRDRVASPLAAIPVAAALPASYYFVLSHTDAAWKLSAKANGAGSQPE